MYKKYILLVILIFVPIVIVFHNWLGSNDIIASDWPYLYPYVANQIPAFPPSWSELHGNGLGGSIIAYYLDQYYYLTIYISTHILHISWVIGYRIFWYILFIVLCFSSPYYLLKKLSDDANVWQGLIAGFIYLTNTYILMIVGGGQMGFALAYAFAPFVLGSFVGIIKRITVNKKKTSYIVSSMVSGLFLGIEIMFDPRVVFILALIIILYVLIHCSKSLLKLYVARNLIIFIIIIPIVESLFLHATWLLPILFFHQNPVSQLSKGYTTLSSLDFFSFAGFSQAFSLLHPYWPENIFGKVSFMRPEFLLIPFVAYLCLFIDYKNKIFGKNIIFLLLLGILGAFLAKGVKDPLGEINALIFQYIPGFSLFRDPTKWYLLTAISYSLSIPLALQSVAMYLNKKSRNLKISPSLIIYGIYFCFYIYWILLLTPALIGNLNGTFAKDSVPQEYKEFENSLNAQDGFFRTLWMPKELRFFANSYSHPSIEASVLFDTLDPKKIITYLSQSTTENLLKNISVKYVIVPYDSHAEYFLVDGKYNENLRQHFEKEVDKIPWLRKIKSGKFAVYQTKDYMRHFSLDKGSVISSQHPNNSLYLISVHIDQPTVLTFTENYSPFWVASIGSSQIYSQENPYGLNQYKLNKTGDYIVHLEYSQEKIYTYGRIIAFMSLVVIISTILVLKFKRKKYEV